MRQISAIAVYLIIASPAWSAENAPKAVQGGSAIWAAIIVLVITAVAAAWLGRNSDIIRDSMPLSFDALAATKDFRRPYSLAQSQMMWWFALILAAFIYIAIIKQGVDNILQEQSLILMGIGTGTALGAAIVEQAKPTNPKFTRFEELAQLIKAAGAVAPSALTAEYLSLANQLKSENFIKDVLSDVDGVSLHRFQSFAWTVVIGVFFAFSTYFNQAMPVFDKYLLAVLGISGATYLGFKIPEQSV